MSQKNQAEHFHNYRCLSQGSCFHDKTPWGKRLGEKSIWFALCFHSIVHPCWSQDMDLETENDAETIMVPCGLFFFSFSSPRTTWPSVVLTTVICALSPYQLSIKKYPKDLATGQSSESIFSLKLPTSSLCQVELKTSKNRYRILEFCCAFNLFFFLKTSVFVKLGYPGTCSLELTEICLPLCPKYWD